MYNSFPRERFKCNQSSPDNSFPFNCFIFKQIKITRMAKEAPAFDG